MAAPDLRGRYEVYVDHPARGRVSTATHSREFAWTMVAAYKRRHRGLAVNVAVDGAWAWTDTPQLGLI